MMTKAEKKAWDEGFFAHDKGKERSPESLPVKGLGNPWPEIGSIAFLSAWLCGWDLAHSTEHVSCPCALKEQVK